MRLIKHLVSEVRRQDPFHVSGGIEVIRFSDLPGGNHFPPDIVANFATTGTQHLAFLH